MSDLEQAIANWRQQMLAAGIKTPVPLEELEIHLREAIERQSKLGLNKQEAFETASGQIGRAEILKDEFVKAKPPAYERLKHFIFVLAGIPNHQLATNMNTTDLNPEPRGTTYFKTFAVLLPPVAFGVLSMIFVFPKFREICRTAGVAFPEVVSAAIAVAMFVQYNFLLLCAGLALVLLLLEWRSRHWPRYRRAAFGSVAFLLNVAVLVWISMMVVFAIVAADKLAGHID